jgi:hypothetical protein
MESLPINAICETQSKYVLCDCITYTYVVHHRPSPFTYKLFQLEISWIMDMQHKIESHFIIWRHQNETDVMKFQINIKVKIIVLWKVMRCNLVGA